MDFINKFLNPFKKKQGGKKQYRDISKESQKLPPNSPSELLLAARDIAGLQLQEKMSKLDGCRWLRAEYTYPSFDDMTFMYKNQIFSVIIDIQDETDTSYLPEEFIARQLHTTDRNNLIPCKFAITIPNPKEPDMSKLKSKSGGWNLINTLTNEPVIPEKLITDEKVEMSDWELRNFGVVFIKKYLHAKRYKVLGFQDTLEVDPQIWFQDESGKKSWILVRCERYSESGVLKPVKLNEIIRRCFSYDGYFAGIMLEEKNSPDNKLFRGDDIKITFNGLEKIHTVM